MKLRCLYSRQQFSEGISNLKFCIEHNRDVIVYFINKTSPVPRNDCLTHDTLNILFYIILNYISLSSAGKATFTFVVGWRGDADVGIMRVANSGW